MPKELNNFEVKIEFSRMKLITRVNPFHAEHILLNGAFNLIVLPDVI